ncbi:nucleotidyltransferase domain-containing protein [Tistrella bauzanensis]|uniref:nucleotidyltransferase domain-containing protein n=1 Tax=Tistrella TaxID=171436 RepID=UPI0031F6A849
MSADAYLQQILNREAVDTGIFSPVRAVQAALEPAIRQWANRFLIGVSASGSFAKGTANRSGTDIDLFISLSSETRETLKEIYESLFTRMQEIGYTPKRQNVSINIRVGAYDVDLVPGKHQGYPGDDHSLYRRRADTWTKTNVRTHIDHVVAANWLSETRILKLWRNQKGLEFPSFYLELAVIKALAPGFYKSGLAADVWKVFQYLGADFSSARIQDPANTNNVISDDLSAAERTAIRAAATRALQAKTWGEIVV